MREDIRRVGKVGKWGTSAGKRLLIATVMGFRRSRGQTGESYWGDMCDVYDLETQCNFKDITEMSISAWERACIFKSNHEIIINIWRRVLSFRNFLDSRGSQSLVSLLCIFSVNQIQINHHQLTTTNHDPIESFTPLPVCKIHRLGRSKVKNPWIQVSTVKKNVFPTNHSKTECCHWIETWRVLLIASSVAPWIVGG